MWQRIQTVFLAISIIALLVALVQPIWASQGDTTNAVLTPFYFLTGEKYQYFPYVVTAILAIASMTVSFTTIRKYKNRLLQMKLGAFNSLLLVGVVGASAYFAMSFIREFQGGHYGLGMYLPIVSVVNNFLANFFIRKDEKMVRDADRIR